MIRVPKELGVIADVVLAYRPPEKAKATKTARKTEGQTCSKETVTILMYIIPKEWRRSLAKISLTRELAVAAATDAGDRSMRSAGRDVWNSADYYAACAEFERLWPLENDLEADCG